MFSKLVALTLALVLMAAGLLVMRQQRIEAAHRTAELHHQIQQTRQALWRAQVDSAGLLRPEAIRRRLRRLEEEGRLAFEPIVPRPPMEDTRWARSDRPGPAADRR